MNEQTYEQLFKFAFNRPIFTTGVPRYCTYAVTLRHKPNKNAARSRTALCTEVNGVSVLSFVLLEAVFLLDGYLLVVAGEDALYHIVTKLRSDKAYERNDDKTCEHRDRTHVDRRCNEVEYHVGYRETYAGNKACPYGELCGLLPIESPEERCEERTCERAP